MIPSISFRPRFGAQPPSEPTPETTGLSETERLALIQMLGRVKMCDALSEDQRQLAKTAITEAFRQQKPLPAELRTVLQSRLSQAPLPSPEDCTIPGTNLLNLSNAVMTLATAAFQQFHDPEPPVQITLPSGKKTWKA